MTVEQFTTYFEKKYHHTSSFLSGTIMLLVDAFSIFITIGLSFFIINAFDPSIINFRSFVTYSIYLPFILVVFYAAGLYPGIMISPAEEVKRITLLIIFCFVGIVVSIIVEDNEEKLAVILAFILAVPIAMFSLPTAREIARRFFGRFSWWGVPAVMYCTGDSGNAIIARLLKRPDLGNKPAVIINSLATGPYEYNGIPVFPPSDEIHQLIKKLEIKVAILCNYKGDLHYKIMNYRYLITVPKEQHIFAGSVQLKDFAGILGFCSTHHLTRKSNLFFRRMVELILLLLLFPFVLPIMIVVSVLIKITSPGPIFYGHPRIGKNRKPLKCWKFRSMYIDADAQLEKILATDKKRKAEWERDRKFTDDPRVTPIGKFLRKTSIDELPQIWNVLVGEMSFVGPRPVTESELARYGENVDFILSVKPGISGMWQVSGRSDTGYEERISLDAYYIQNWSIWLDLWIAIKTVWVVFTSRGAY